MMYGFAFAVNEISLVLFTTLAPSGALAFVLMAIPLFKGGIDGDARGRLSKLLCIPLVVTMVGLVASATHLGNPDNALYVIAGIGRSPLSTEVASAVAFLALAGVYWLLTFGRRFPLALQRVWLVAAAIAALAFVGAVAFAYGRETIVTWNLWQVPAALCLNALVGGPILALAGFRAARTPLEGRRRFWRLPRLRSSQTSSYTSRKASRFPGWATRSVGRSIWRRGSGPRLRRSS